MIVRINTEADLQAIAIIASLQNYRSVGELLAMDASMRCSEGETYEVTISKSLLSDSYRSNPSMLALKMREKCGDKFPHVTGFQTVANNKCITIKMMPTERPAGQTRTPNKPSVKRLIKEWLELNYPKWRKLFIPVEAITPFYFTHPEMLTYQVKRETQGAQIKIQRTQKQWIITRQ